MMIKLAEKTNKKKNIVILTLRSLDLEIFTSLGAAESTPAFDLEVNKTPPKEEAPVTAQDTRRPGVLDRVLNAGPGVESILFKVFKSSGLAFRRTLFLRGVLARGVTEGALAKVHISDILEDSPSRLALFNKVAKLSMDSEEEIMEIAGSANSAEEADSAPTAVMISPAHSPLIAGAINISPKVQEEERVAFSCSS